MHGVKHVRIAHRASTRLRTLGESTLCLARGRQGRLRRDGRPSGSSTLRPSKGSAGANTSVRGPCAERPSAACHPLRGGCARPPSAQVQWIGGVGYRACAGDGRRGERASWRNHHPGAQGLGRLVAAPQQRPDAASEPRFGIALRHAGRHAWWRRAECAGDTGEAERGGARQTRRGSAGAACR